jgi:GT2 family glycosyltransferase
VLNQFLDSDFLRGQFPRSSLWGTAAFLSDGCRPEVVEVVSGACVMVKRSVFEQVRGFTERYFMYGEDLDLCFKIRRAGCCVYYLPQTAIVHHGGGSTRQGVNRFSSVMMRESVYRFLRFNRGLPSAAAYRGAMAGSALLRVLLILPLLIVARNRVVKNGPGSLHKWLAILRWSIGMETWARNQSSGG